MWDAAKYEVKAIVRKDGAPIGELTLVPGKSESSFEGLLEATEAGDYQVTLFAFDPANGNAGVDAVSFTVR